MNPALATLIAFLRADVQTETDIAKLGRVANGLQTVGVNTTTIALASMAASARALIRNMAFVDRDVLPALRMTLLALSDALELQAKHLPGTPDPKAEAEPEANLPWHQRH